jgi:pimeloyl-ACP methyl ester carboxylesterase
MSAPDETDPDVTAPLARFQGERPPAPAWFAHSLAHAPERSFVSVEGADIELLAWGERGKPGLMFLHGGRAHADWFSFIAPFFADDFRVAAISMSGAGRSDWREAYDVAQYGRELVAGAHAAGLFEAQTSPVFVGHSFGSRPVMAVAARTDLQLRGAVILDAAVSSPDAPEIHFSPPRISRVYPSLKSALQRFRLMPSQPCENAYLLDHIARESLKLAPGEDGQDGLTWRFDPCQFQRLAGGVRDGAAVALKSAQCPLAFIWGEQSRIVQPANLAYTRSITPPGTVFASLPQAGHHLFLDQPLAVVSALRVLLASWAL